MSFDFASSSSTDGNGDVFSFLKQDTNRCCPWEKICCHFFCVLQNCILFAFQSTLYHNDCHYNLHVACNHIYLLCESIENILFCLRDGVVDIIHRVCVCPQSRKSTISQVCSTFSPMAQNTSRHERP